MAGLVPAISIHRLLCRMTIEICTTKPVIAGRTILALNASLTMPV